LAQREAQKPPNQHRFKKVDIAAAMGSSAGFTQLFKYQALWPLLNAQKHADAAPAFAGLLALMVAMAGAGGCGDLLTIAAGIRWIAFSF
jgi:hypothetical protein